MAETAVCYKALIQLLTFLYLLLLPLCVKVSWLVLLFCLYGLRFYNSYGHVEMVSSPNHTFCWASLAKPLTSTLCTYFRL